MEFGDEKDVFYPEDDGHNPDRLILGSFRVRTLWIEFAGRMLDTDHASTMAERKSLVQR
jgi:hypothetical protein